MQSLDSASIFREEISIADMNIIHKDIPISIVISKRLRKLHSKRYLSKNWL